MGRAGISGYQSNLERQNPETGEPLRVIDGMPEGTPVPDFPELPEQFAPGIDRDDCERILKRLKSNM